MVDPRTPVVVGVGQRSQRPADPLEALEPIELLAEAARAADADTDARSSLVARADTVAVVQMVSWGYPDPGALLARLLGCEPRTTLTTTTGGNSPQMLLNALAAGIAAGEADVVLLGGADCIYTRWRARRDPSVWLPWTTAEDPPCPRVLGDDRPGTSDGETAHLALAPTDVYPLFETALRARAGRTVEEHQQHVAELWARFAAVAARNPNAWSRTAYTPEEIRTPSPDNRVVTFPYTKRMCANIDVDQAAALILCSYEAARGAGVPDERLVFPLAGAEACDRWFFSQRWSPAESPAIRAVGGDLVQAAGLDLDGVARFDLYSCFPSAVQIALDALGLGGPGDDRPLTVTGGLAFAGGPVNDYVTHAIATMVDECRRDPGSVGMVSAIGWYVTKHAAGLYSTTPPADGFTRVDPARTQARVDAGPAREPAGPFEGEATVEATAVVHDRDGAPTVAIVTLLTPDGRRALANSRDPDALASMVSEAWEGRPVEVRTDGATNTLV